MSWNPVIWLKRKDYLKVKNLISDRDAFEFSIAGVEGVAICNSEFSSENRELHEKICEMEHWILDGEGGDCDKCQAWGEKINDRIELGT